MVMTFILYPLSHYNSIIEPCARFLLSLLEVISIDFPSHFILSFIDIYRDTAISDKLIFLSTIMQIMCHFSVSFPESPHFTVMSAIDAATVRRSEAQLRPRRPRIETMTPLASTIYVDIYWGCYYFISPIFTRVVSFLSLCTWFLYTVCNLLFLFHIKMSWWVLFKVFQKYRLSKSSCHKLSSCKVFQEFVLG